MRSHKKEDESAELRALRDRVHQLEKAAAVQRQASEEVARVLALHRELAWGILRSTTIGETSQFCAQAMVRHLGAALARVWILNERENMLELQASAGLYTHTDGPHGRIRVGEFKIGLIAQGRQPHLTNSIIGDPRVPNQEWAKREGLVSFAGYPMLIDDHLVGVVAMFAREPLSEIILQAVRSVAGRVAYAVERVRNDEKLRASERCFRALIEHSSDAISRLDRQGTILFASGSTARILGHEPSALSGTSGFALIHPEDQDTAHRTLSDVARQPGATATTELRVCHKDGHWIWAECVLTNWLEDPSVNGIVLNWRDITERKRNEEAIRHTQKMASLGVLAGGIAHDFNNLLTTILGYANLVASATPESDPRHERLRAVSAAAEKAAYLVRQLLAYAGKGRFTTQPVDVSELVEQATSVTALPDNVRLELQLAAGLPVVNADPAQLEHVIANVVLNAVESIEEGRQGCVTVSTAEIAITEDYTIEHPPGQEVAPGRYVAVQVRDNGPGIDPETLERIFDPFFTTKHLGRGLGLCAVLGAAKAHKGAVELKSSAGEGTIVRLLFPSSTLSKA